MDGPWGAEQQDEPWSHRHGVSHTTNDTHAAELRAMKPKLDAKRILQKIEDDTAIYEKIIKLFKKHCA